MLSGKKILITGGTGSFGKSFIEHVLKQFNPKKLVIYSRDEQKQFLAQKNWTGKKYSCLRFLIGDIRDTKRLTFAMNDDIDIVIHAAAMKHVPIAEYNPFEVVKTNIIGAQNVIEAAFENNVEKVIALSTDKASSPINLYGASKLTSDKLFIAANNYVGKRSTKFSVVRYGNVMGSKGSVIPILLEEKRKKGIFSITDQNMTRFNITMAESIDFILFCLKKMQGGEIFVPKIPSYRLIDLVRAVSESSNPKINLIGIRPGEKMHEEMISVNDALNTIEFENYYVIVPSSYTTKWSYKRYLTENKSAKKCPQGFSYSSENNKKFLTIKEIKNLIKNNL